jgi:ribosome-binding protein aMBF1 (putative translation factor)
LLQRKLDAAEMSQNELARQLEVEGGVVSRWASGVRRPDPHLREAVERILGIKTSDWMTDAEYLVAFGRERRTSAA